MLARKARSVWWNTKRIWQVEKIKLKEERTSWEEWIDSDYIIIVLFSN